MTHDEDMQSIKKLLSYLEENVQIARDLFNSAPIEQRSFDNQKYLVIPLASGVSIRSRLFATSVHLTTLTSKLKEIQPTLF